MREKFNRILYALQDFLGLAKKDYKFKTPQEGDDTLPDYVQALFDDGLEFVKNHWVATARMRPAVSGVVGAYTAERYREYCDLLEAGNDWEVWGRRNVGIGDRWKQESVDGLIGRNMRVRRAYLTGNYHDIVITPNIQNIAEIYDQERQANGYGEWIDEYVHTAQAYGMATARLYIDSTEEMPRIRKVVCEPGTVVRTPNTKSFAKRDGCWYAAHGTMINDRQAEELFGSLDGLAESKTLSEKLIKYRNEKDVVYTHTKMFPKIELFLDDDTIEEIPFTEEEEEELAVENESLMMGNPVQAVKGQNHKKHIESKQEALNNFMSTLPPDDSELPPEDQAYAIALIEAYSENIAQHMEMMDEEDLASIGLRFKYPYGRYVCMVGGKLYHDGPSQYADLERGIGVDWRKLFDELHNERVLGRNDGRGDPEILWQDAKACDTALSRYDDSVIRAAGQVYLPISDKDITQPGMTNDPTQVRYTNGQPYYFKPDIARENLEVWKLRRSNASEAQGVNNITIGGEPENQSSGYQTELLQRQNEQMVTGELDRNLRASLERIGEAEVELMKVFYVAPRPYFINGQVEYISVSEILSYQMVQGQKIPIPKLEFTVKPYSNYPNRWEHRLGFMLKMASITDAMGMPMFPNIGFAIRDHIAIEYPEFSENGKYGQLSEMMQIAMQLLKQRQAQEEAAVTAVEQQQSDISNVRRGFQRKMMQNEMSNVLPMNGEQQ